MVEGSESHEKVVPVFIYIYEDQDGSLKYPELEHLDKTIERETNDIVLLFERKITLLLIKKNEKLKAYCRFFASRMGNREEGFYIVYEENYSDHFFHDYKKFGEIALSAIELSLTDSEENSIFKNISFFDTYNENSSNIQSQNGFSFNELDLETLKQALVNKEKLTYVGGVSPALSKFIKNILKNVPNFQICISSEQMKLFGINIQNKLNAAELRCTEDTQKILNEYQKKLRIENAKQNIKESISQLKSCNWSDFEVDDYLFKNCSSLSPSKNNYSDFTRNLFRLLENADYERMLDWGIIHEKFAKQPIYTHLVNSQIRKSNDLTEPITSPSSLSNRKHSKYGVISDYIYMLKLPCLLLLTVLLVFVIIKYCNGDIEVSPLYENRTFTFWLKIVS